MRRNTLKLLAFACVAALGASTVAKNTFAQGTVNLGVTLGSSSAFTVNQSAIMDFGTWFLHFDTNDITLVMAADTGVVTPGAVAPSQATEITAGAQPGNITLTPPGAATIDVYATCNDDWGTNAAAYAITLPTYDWANGRPVAASGALSTAVGAPTQITTEDNTAHTMLLGSTITVGAQPADASPDAATIDVIFAYP